MPQTILITGANRGLGLEFVKQYAKENNRIIACCKNPSEALELSSLAEQHQSISIYKLEVTSQNDIFELSNKVTQPIDILINNAGFLERDMLDDVSPEVMMQTFYINAVAPLMITKAFRQQVASSKRKLVVAITSAMGSIHENTSGGYYSYRTSKAALNMIMKSAAIDLADAKIQVLLLHPGWVKTRMGGERAEITPEISVQGMRKVIEGYNPKWGELAFYRYNGSPIAW